MVRATMPLGNTPTDFEIEICDSLQSHSPNPSTTASRKPRARKVKRLAQGHITEQISDKVRINL